MQLDPHTRLEDLAIGGGNPFSNLFQLMKKAEDCEEVDCDKIKCPECETETLQLKSGTLPLQVACSNCGNVYFLKDFVTKS